MADNEIMVTHGLVECSWRLMNRQTVVDQRGGSQVVDFGSPYWMINFVYQHMVDTEWRELSAWITRRQGAKSPFKAFRAMSRRPQGGATSCSASGQGNGTVTASASPALQVGDMIAFDATAGGRNVVELVANNGGNNWDCLPPALVGSGSPECVDAGGYFILMPDSLQVTETYDIKRRVTFQARQVEPG